MTQEEILQYNQRCAEFLGAIYSEDAEAWGFGNAKNIGSKMFQGVMYHDVIQAERFEKELKFDSDWNWIMEVVEAIENLFDGDILVEISDESCYMGYHKEYEMYTIMSTKKEAVVQAINQFLIWYKQK